MSCIYYESSICKDYDGYCDNCPVYKKTLKEQPEMTLDIAINSGKEFTNDLIAYTVEGQKWFKNSHELLKYMFSKYDDAKQIDSILGSNKWKIREDK
jgi:hypothetical protein